jgi:hypothetical protein
LVSHEFTKSNYFVSLAPLELKQTPNDVNVLQSQNTQITFEVDGLPRPNVTWLFNGSPLQPSAKHKMETKGNQIVLNINKTDFVDSGTYTAVVDNGIERIEVPVKMNVGGNINNLSLLAANTYHFFFFYLVKPKIEASKPATEQSCVIDQDTQISWKFSGTEKPKVTWFFNGQPLPTNDRLQITETEDGISTLSIHHAELTDKGVYTAKATNAVGEVEAKTTLNIAGVKPVVTADLEGGVQATKGESMTLKIAVTGTPKPDIVWMRGNDELVPSDRIQVTAPTAEGDDTYTLTILNVQPDDQGEYTAKITNVGGTLKSKKSKVTVTSK